MPVVLPAKSELETHQLVHKRLETAALVQWCASGDSFGEFHIGVDWSCERATVFSATRTVDLMVVAETVRQASIMLAHCAFDVPMQAAFAMSGLRAKCSANLSGLSPDDRADAYAHVKCRDVVKRAGALVSMTVSADILVRGTVIARGDGALKILPLEIYRQIRRGRTPIERVSSRKRLAGHVAGRGSSQDVVLASDNGNGNGNGNGNDLRLVIDTSHRGLYDHPMDHIPGMAVIEACRQAFYFRIGHQPHFMDAKFYSYLELDDDPILKLTTTTKAAVVNVHQRNTLGATISLAVSKNA